MQGVLLPYSIGNNATTRSHLFHQCVVTNTQTNHWLVVNLGGEG